MADTYQPLFQDNPYMGAADRLRRRSEAGPLLDPIDPAKDWGDQTARSIVARTEAYPAGLAVLGKRLIGADEASVQESAQSFMEQNERARELGPDIQSFEDAEKAGGGVGNYGAALGYMAAEMVPDMVGGIGAGAVVGGLARRNARKSLIRNEVERIESTAAHKLATDTRAEEIAKSLVVSAPTKEAAVSATAKLAQQQATDEGRKAVMRQAALAAGRTPHDIAKLDRAQRVGVFAGATAGQFPGQAQEDVEFLAEKPRSQTDALKVLAGTGASSAIGSVPIERLLGQFAPAAMAKAQQATQRASARVAKEMAAQGLSEGVTEVAQSFAQLAGHKAVDDSIDLFDEKARDNYWASFLAGSVLGGAFGGAGEVARSGGDVAGGAAKFAWQKSKPLRDAARSGLRRVADWRRKREDATDAPVVDGSGFSGVSKLQPPEGPAPDAFYSDDFYDAANRIERSFARANKRQALGLGEQQPAVFGSRPAQYAPVDVGSNAANDVLSWLHPNSSVRTDQKLLSASGHVVGKMLRGEPLAKKEAKLVSTLQEQGHLPAHVSALLYAAYDRKSDVYAAQQEAGVHDEWLAQNQLEDPENAVENVDTMTFDERDDAAKEVASEAGNKEGSSLRDALGELSMSDRVVNERTAAALLRQRGEGAADDTLRGEIADETVQRELEREKALEGLRADIFGPKLAGYKDGSNVTYLKPDATPEQKKTYAQTLREPNRVELITDGKGPRKTLDLSPLITKHHDRLDQYDDTAEGNAARQNAARQAALADLEIAGIEVDWSTFTPGVLRKYGTNQRYIGKVSESEAKELRRTPTTQERQKHVAIATSAAVQAGYPNVAAYAKARGLPIAEIMSEASRASEILTKEPGLPPIEAFKRASRERTPTRVERGRNSRDKNLKSMTEEEGILADAYAENDALNRAGDEGYWWENIDFENRESAMGEDKIDSGGTDTDVFILGPRGRPPGENSTGEFVSSEALVSGVRGDRGNKAVAQQAHDAMVAAMQASSPEYAKLRDQLQSILYRLTPKDERGKVPDFFTADDDPLLRKKSAEFRRAAAFLKAVNNTPEYVRETLLPREKDTFLRGVYEEAVTKIAPAQWKQAKKHYSAQKDVAAAEINAHIDAVQGDKKARAKLAAKTRGQYAKTAAKIAALQQDGLNEIPDRAGDGLRSGDKGLNAFGLKTAERALENELGRGAAFEAAFAAIQNDPDKQFEYFKRALNGDFDGMRFFERKADDEAISIREAASETEALEPYKPYPGSVMAKALAAARGGEKLTPPELPDGAKSTPVYDLKVSPEERAPRPRNPNDGLTTPRTPTKQFLVEQGERPSVAPAPAGKRGTLSLNRTTRPSPAESAPAVLRNGKTTVEDAAGSQNETEDAAYNAQFARNNRPEDTPFYSESDGVPVMITGAMKNALAKKGFKPFQIKAMTPQQAHEALGTKAESTQAAAPTTPETFLADASTYANTLLSSLGLGDFPVEVFGSDVIDGKTERKGKYESGRRIVLRNNLTPKARIATLTHEIGHHIVRAYVAKIAGTKITDVPYGHVDPDAFFTALAKADKPLHDALRADFEAFRSAASPDAFVADAAALKKSPLDRRNAGERAQQKARGAQVRELDAGQFAYLMSFDEWVADHLARALTTNKDAVGLVEKFFADVAKLLRRAWNLLTKQGAAPAASVDAWVKSMFDANRSVVSEIIGVPVTAKETESVIRAAAVTSISVENALDVEKRAGYNPTEAPNAFTLDMKDEAAVKAFRDFVRLKLGPDERAILDAVFSREAVRARMRKVLKNAPDGVLASLDDAKTGMLNRITYGYAMWQKGAFRVGPKAENLMHDWTDDLLRTIGVLGDGDLAQRILADVATGAVNKIMEVEGKYDVRELAARSRGDLQRLMNWAVKPGPIKDAIDLFWTSQSGWMRAAAIPAFDELDALLHKPQGMTGDDLGLHSESVHTSARLIRKALAPLSKLEPPQRAMVMDMLQRQAVGEKTFDVPDAVQAAAESMREFMDEMYDYMNGAGIKFDKRANFFPVVFDHNNPNVRDTLTTLYSQPHFEAALRDTFGKWNKDKTARVPDNKTPVAELVTRMVDMAVVEPWELDTAATGDDALSFRHENYRISQFVYGAKGDTRAPEQRAADIKTFASVQSKDAAEVVSRYVESATKYAAYTRRLGGGDNNRAKLDDILARAKAEGATDKQIARAENAVKAAIGTYGIDESPTIAAFSPAIAKKFSGRKTRAFVRGAQAYQNVRLLPLALLSSLVDPMGIAVRTGGDFNTAWDGFRAGMSTLWNEANRADLDAALAAVGSADDFMHAIAYSESFGTGGGWSRRINDVVFKANGMAAWVRTTRYMAIHAAHGFVLQHAKSDSEHSQRYLDELGVKRADIVADASRPDRVRLLDDAELKTASAEEKARDERVRSALREFVDNAILRPHSQQMPLWYKDPFMGLVVQYKQFAYAIFDQIGGRISRELQNGNMRILLPMLAYLPVALMAELLREFIQYGPDGNPKRQGWGALEYTSAAAMKTGLQGPKFETLSGIENDIETNRAPGASLVGPTANQAEDVGSAFFGQRRWSTEAENAAPASPLWKHWNDETVTAEAAI